MFRMEWMFFKVEMPLNLTLPKLKMSSLYFQIPNRLELNTYEVLFQTSSEVNKAFLHSMEKMSTKVDFSPISCKKAPFYTRNGHF